MSFRRHLLSCVLLTLPIVFSSRPAVAFNLIFSSSEQNAYTSYEYYRTFSGSDGYVMVNSIEKLSAPNPVSNGVFWNVLTSSYGTGWNFQSAGGTPLYGAFDVKNYRTCSPQTEPPVCGIDKAFRVGAELEVDYIPNLALGDRDPNTGRVRWIQWVRSNHSLISGQDPDLTHGIPESVIDVSGSHGTPYYYGNSDMANRRSPYFFTDISSRGDADFQHDWIAQLFLAVEEPQTQGSTTRTVTLYGGIEWGWFNRVVRRNRQPDPNPVCPANNNSAGSSCSPDDPPPFDPPDGLCFNSSEGTYEPCDYSFSARSSSQDADPSSELTSVPEPTPTAALLAVGAWAGISWRKRKSEQKPNAGDITEHRQSTRSLP